MPKMRSSLARVVTDIDGTHRHPLRPRKERERRVDRAAGWATAFCASSKVTVGLKEDSQPRGASFRRLRVRGASDLL